MRLLAPAAPRPWSLALILLFRCSVQLLPSAMSSCVLDVAACAPHPPSLTPSHSMQQLKSRTRAGQQKVGRRDLRDRPRTPGKMTHAVSHAEKFPPDGILPTGKLDVEL
jgi:hypothetical protein